MLYLYSNPGNPPSNTGQLYAYNLTTGEQTSLSEIPSATTLTGLVFASDNSDRAIFTADHFAGALDKYNIIQVDTENATILKLGEVDKPINTICYNVYDKSSNFAYFIIFDNTQNEYGLIKSNLTSSSSTYSTIGNTQQCPMATVSEDFKTFYLLVNSSFLVTFDNTDGQLASVETIFGLSDFMSSGQYQQQGGIVEYKSNVYGISVNSQSNFTLWRVDFQTLTVDYPLQISGNPNMAFALPNYPAGMFSRDSSHLVIPMMNQSVFQFWIHDLETLSNFVLKPQDSLPTSVQSYYLVYNQVMENVYPEKAILGVTFGYGVVGVIVIAVVLFIIFRNDWGSLIEAAKSWPLSRLCKIANIIFFFLGCIKLVVIYALSAQIDVPGLALVSSYMEIHKALFGIFMSVFYHYRMVPAYYFLSALSVFFNFVSFCTLFKKNIKIIETDKPGVSFIKFDSIFIAIYSAAFLVYFFLRVRKSSKSSDNDFSYKSSSGRDSLAYNPILNNDYEDDE
ncbi:hypothetical protein DLAC_09370 [Tieghemostelium lacteum]|uniref:Uncharacterized protein n=1 Tax=Tieghemostelium lacteum TaxID=361077 RepID=A0A151Z9X5_TIELA|nr:hypothetical protein DLAC_09370 [Tieghemostelium lacteum]|eukprot:KYQ90733.1 hypothetical protein DLAC_09370 [Tieghemostelium lacteum]